MEILAAVVSAVLAPTCGKLFSSIRIKNLQNFQACFADLDREMNDLLRRRETVKQDLEAAERVGQVPRAAVKDWLQEVNDIEAQVNEMKTQLLQESNFYIIRRGCSCSNQENLRLAASEKLAEVKRLLEAGSFRLGVAAPIIVEHIPGPSIEDQPTAARNIARVMDLLSNEEAKMIGIWGMGGVGKTTLVKNVNNKLKNINSPLAEVFSIVIWVIVANKSNESSALKRVQQQIAKRLKISFEGGGGDDDDDKEIIIARRAIQLHERLEKEKFLLILDDVWNPIDLYAVGVPQPETPTGSKILLTTRSSEVCDVMRANFMLKVEVLNESEAWELFCKYAGDAATLADVEPHAKAVTRECCGVPLAIIVVGASLRGKETVELWEDAINRLRNLEHTGIENKVYSSLKWSYDSLPDKKMKSCFLFCCLYPEDYSIYLDDLVRYWLAEGLLDENRNIEDVRIRGIAMIEHLKNSCLLEIGRKKATVKMNDVVRDVAVWIASSFEDECKSVVKSGIGLKSITEDTIFKSARRLSFMCNEMHVLPESVTVCPLASTLLLQYNGSLAHVPDEFLQAFLSLRVLDLSGCPIESLPFSLNQLVQLRALILAGCEYLGELPPIGGLGELQVLDCSHTNIKALPEGMERLTSLRQLDLSYISSSTTICTGTIAGLSSLETLKLSRSTGKWFMKGSEEGGSNPTPLKEILLLRRLLNWEMDFDSIPGIKISERDALIHFILKLKKFRVNVGSIAFPSRGLVEEIDNKRSVTFNGHCLSGEWIGWLFLNATSVHLCDCEGLNLMFEEIAKSCSSVGSFNTLSRLDIVKSSSSFELTASCDVQSDFDLLPNLKTLHLSKLTGLTCISVLAEPLRLQFPSLRRLEIVNCSRLKYLLSLSCSVMKLGQLKEITVESCEELEELFCYDSANSSPSQSLAPDDLCANIQLIRLKNLPKLESFSRPSAITCPLVEKVEVINCHLLKRLPLSITSTTLKEIKGTPEWWHQLEWDDEDIRSNLENFFIPVSEPEPDPEPEPEPELELEPEPEPQSEFELEQHSHSGFKDLSDTESTQMRGAYSDMGDNRLGGNLLRFGPLSQQIRLKRPNH
ncbi:hypothetical protein ACH5RR_027939 [Cinchona calisaya]|uniref:AAA+ ATPase domain-containing protein n=1 Tax=Cinchona calisaya TaxID=153742 RepID=A0ABD2YNI5_9GENT